MVQWVRAPILFLDSGYHTLSVSDSKPFKRFSRWRLHARVDVLEVGVVLECQDRHIGPRKGGSVTDRDESGLAADRLSDRAGGPGRQLIDVEDIMGEIGEIVFDQKGCGVLEGDRVLLRQPAVFLMLAGGAVRVAMLRVIPRVGTLGGPSALNDRSTDRRNVTFFGLQAFAEVGDQSSPAIVVADGTLRCVDQIVQVAGQVKSDRTARLVCGSDQRIQVLCPIVERRDLVQQREVFSELCRIGLEQVVSGLEEGGGASATIGVVWTPATPFGNNAKKLRSSPAVMDFAWLLKSLKAVLAAFCMFEMNVPQVLELLG